MGDFHAAYPDYAATARLDDLRSSEYSYLDEGGHVYLDYTGAGLAARSQLAAHTTRLSSGCYGNPHSENPTSSASTLLVEQARAAVLRYFNTAEDEYAVIFTPNATGACRLVAEAYPFGRGSSFAATADNHNSVNGIREFAKAGGARVRYVPLTAPELRVDEAELRTALGRGRLLPNESAFEDGTLNFLAIPEVAAGLRWISDIGIDPIHQRVCCLAGWLIDSLTRLKHSNGVPLVRLYGPPSVLARGGTVTLNFLDPDGRPVDERAVSRDASAAGISLRTGCFCNPGAAEYAFGLTRRDVRGPWWAPVLRGQGFLSDSMSTVDDYLDLIGLPTGGAVRVSLGMVSTLADVESFLDFAERTYRDRHPDLTGLAPRLQC